MTVADSQHSVLLENVYKLINKKVAPERVEQVTSFSKILFKNIAYEDLDNRVEDNLYGATLSLWNQFVDYKGDAPFIRAFNPAISKHGWQSIHTIVEIIVTDMPFLVDSVRMALNKMGITAHLLLHCPIGLQRDKQHTIVSFESNTSKNKEVIKQTVFMIEVDRQTSKLALEQLTVELMSVVNDVSMAVQDWQPMRTRLREIIEEFKYSQCPISAIQKKQTENFLVWLNDHNFTLMGYRSYSAHGSGLDKQSDGHSGCAQGSHRKKQYTPHSAHGSGHSGS